MRRRTFGWMLAALAIAAIAVWILGRADVDGVPEGSTGRDGAPASTPLLEGREVPPATSPAAAPPPASPPAPAAVPPKPAVLRWVEGRVVDPEGRGIEGVPLISDPPSKKERHPEGPDVEPIAWSGVGGAFGLRMAEDGWLGVGRAPGRIRPEAVWLGGTKGEIVFVLHPAVTVQGVVLDASGQPVAGAHVVALWHSVDRRVRGGWSGRTSEDGTFRVVVLRSAPRVSVTALVVLGNVEGSVREGHAVLAPVPDPPPTLVVRLAAESPVEGVVVDETGAAVPGAEVIVNPDGRPNMLYTGATTDAAGRFRVRSLSRGPHWLWAHVPLGSHAPSVPVRFEAPASDVRITCPRARTLRGRIVDDDAAGFTVTWFYGRSSPHAASLFRTARTAPDGSFAIVGVAAGDTALHAHRGGDDRYARVDRPDPAQPQELRLVNGGRVAGRLEVPQDVMGDPFRPEEISLRLFGDGLSLTTRPAPDGRFEFRGVPPGRWRIDASPESGAPDVDGPESVEAGTTDVVLTVR